MTTVKSFAQSILTLMLLVTGCAEFEEETWTDEQAPTQADAVQPHRGAS